MPIAKVVKSWGVKNAVCIKPLIYDIELDFPSVLEGVSFSTSPEKGGTPENDKLERGRISFKVLHVSRGCYVCDSTEAADNGSGDLSPNNANANNANANNVKPKPVIPMGFLYVDVEDLPPPSKKYYLNQLLGFVVILNDSEYGCVRDVADLGGGPLITVAPKEDHNDYIFLHVNSIVCVDLTQRMVHCKQEYI